ncbi:NAD(P)-dependent dehydrogenase, short-chain alcohol dehydrogenase family [Ekhidna lutea]|uniref:NAD(P)-dependent dehydrogenase, short-chain alcohol dehydrogenase family n=1 Tax=Ekhidna lutea TaxID=447679 RepID=A0A239K577_EKHLU|nr:SDR family oxidoreductase [Ekhidna lutea]SNT12779.1 NAD(P)-dependent dehydrogenase, short-chain alcohol dehydrogenase family [Ekhidna lutea]
MSETKVAIITAASKGMGLSCAEKLAEEGYQLAILSRSSEIHDLASKFGGIAVQGSTDNVEDLSRLVDATLETYGQIDVVVNNTGHPPKGELLELTDEQWKQGFDLALMNVIRMSRLVTPHMSGGGSIVNISTFGAKEPSLNFPISSVARTALSSFTKLFTANYASSNIRMNNVLPGFIDSYPATEETINQIPMLRQGTPDEVAELVSFLADDKSAYITGQDFLIDGGLVKSI